MSFSNDLVSVDWNTFIKEGLLQLGLVDGLVVVTQHGNVVEEFGELSGVPESDWSSLSVMFKYSNQKHDEQICKNGVQLHTKRGLINYRIFQKTFTSIYGVSRDDCSGLIISNLPYGTLIASYSNLTTCSGDVIKAVERFCDRLRT